MTPSYDPRSFWEDRIRSDPSYAAVGHAGLGQAYNRWLYRARFLAVARVLGRHGVRVDGRAVLDAGVGVGAWIPFWEGRGASTITGVDISQTAIDCVRQRFPGGHFHQADLMRGLAVSRKFDTVTAFDVLYHIVDEPGFDRAVQSLEGALRPEDWLLVIDGFGEGSSQAGAHVVHRSLRRYDESLEGVGLQILDVQPIFFLMEAPAGTYATPLARRSQTASATAHRIVSAMLRRNLEPLNHLLGAVLFSCDAALGSIAATGPSLKVVIAARHS